jgi:hypothetical protein
MLALRQRVYITHNKGSIPDYHRVQISKIILALLLPSFSEQLNYVTSLTGEFSSKWAISPWFWPHSDRYNISLFGYILLCLDYSLFSFHLLLYYIVLITYQFCSLKFFCFWLFLLHHLLTTICSIWSRLCNNRIRQQKCSRSIWNKKKFWLL